MPIYSVDIEKRLGSEFWSNRYILRHGTLEGAQAFTASLVSTEAQFHNPAVAFTRYRISDTTVGSDVYLIVPMSLNGGRADASALLPLFNTLRMDITATSGRPSRKYYRGVLTENDISGDAVVADFSAFAAALDTLLPDTAGGNGLVDPQAQDLVEFVVMPNVQMRQLRRSRRKRTNGGGIFQ